MRKFLAFLLLALSLTATPGAATPFPHQLNSGSWLEPTLAAFNSFQASSSVIPPTCSSSVIDAHPASPGIYAAAFSLRKTRAAYVGSAVQLQRTSDGQTLDIGFSGCNPDTVAPASFCSTQPLSAGTTTSNRTTLPPSSTGGVVFAVNLGPNLAFWAQGNGSVTATIASNALPFNQAVPITVGSDTNFAALVGAGFGVNGGAGSANIVLTNCSVSKFYEQTGSGVGDATPITAGYANRMAYVPGAWGSLPLLYGCLVNCGLKVPDSAIYKTSVIETFTLLIFSEGLSTNGYVYTGVSYPQTTTSDGYHVVWGLTNGANADILINNLNGSTNANAEGFGGIFRGQTLTQYDYSTAGSTRWNGGTEFLNSGAGTPTYTNAVGMYIMGAADGTSTPGGMFEALVLTGTQTARNSISADQVSFASVTTGTASSVPLTNPLGDGFNWSQQQTGSIAPSPPGAGPIAINGNNFYTESAWNNWSSWQCSNCITSGGQLGDLWRFQVAFGDQWDGSNRSELDGSGGAICNQDIDCWYSWAVFIEPGTPYTSTWNITGQDHTTTNGICCRFNVSYLNEKFVAATASYTDTITQYTSPTVTRGVWHHFVAKTHPSSSAAAGVDTFDLWYDSTPGTMAHVASATGGTCTACSISGSTLTVAGTLQGAFSAGQQMVGTNVPTGTPNAGSGTIISAQLTGAAGGAGTYSLLCNNLACSLTVGSEAMVASLYTALNVQSYWKMGIYRGYPNETLPVFAVWNGNIQQCIAGSGCTAKYGVSTLVALTTTPLANPSH